MVVGHRPTPIGGRNSVRNNVVIFNTIWKNREASILPVIMHSMYIIMLQLEVINLHLATLGKNITILFAISAYLRSLSCCCGHGIASISSGVLVTLFLLSRF